jgi:hypothetical protein
MTVDSRATKRAELVDRIRAELIGPAGGETEVIRERPDWRYLMGMLFPQNVKGSALADEEETNASAGDVVEEGDDSAALESPVDMMFQVLPSTAGLSFAVAPGGPVSLDVTLSAAEYEEASSNWKRRPLAPAGGVKLRLELSGAQRSQNRPVFDGRATVAAVLRPGARGSEIVTVTLVNERKGRPSETNPRKMKFDSGDVLCQVCFSVVPSRPAVRWPSPQRIAEDLEEDELLLQYRQRIAFAVGHGCSAAWEESGDGTARRLWTEFMPTHEIAPVTTDIRELADAVRRVLSIHVLQNDREPFAGVATGLDAFVDSYAAWRRRLEQEQAGADGLEAARDRILGRIDSVIERMRAGIRLLSEDADALYAFRLANRAMLMQMDYAARVAAVEESGAAPRPEGVSNVDAPHLTDRAWRPFQLAFLLMVLPELWNEDHPKRELVDLIWFPTGGGKTEAYLGAIAFTAIARRLQSGVGGGGTAAIMRYTLRLLTQQQFQRAAHLITALDDLRRSGAHRRLGDESFSLGLWIGTGATPATLSDAHEQYQRFVYTPAGDGAKNPFALLGCPCCGTRLVPASKSELSSDGVGIRSTTASFAFFCPDPRCHRHNGIPVQVIDEPLYAAPPTLLLGTLDKFAMLAWRPEASAFFGARGAGEPVLPPSLIVQDELHLITGPLGTVSGVYEAAIDSLIDGYGGRAKRLCATATIRRVVEQARALYARPVSVFPPPGVDAADAFFSRTDSSSGPGRLYVGAMAQGHTPTFSTVMTASAMLQAVADMTLTDRERDAWWTLVAYHNSKRELGKTLTLARDDIPARLEALAAPEPGGGTERRARQILRVSELSANVKGPDIPKVLDELKLSLETGGAVDVLCCTNMLSVGVDVGRLGKMLVVGQPKTTSEYIQATSRVGRTRDRLPGVVLTLYMPTKPRDRSHYETFTGYHAALYRYVEPTSVTPFALPARTRALHAAIVAAVRNSIDDLAGNARARQFDPSDAAVRATLDALLKRMLAADPGEKAGIEADFREFERHWERETGGNLRYSTARGAQNYAPLMKRFGEARAQPGRPTLQSMRNVDVGIRASLLGQPRGQRNA